MSEKAKRLYKGKDTEMVVTISTITESAIADKAFLITKRSAWADPFFSDVQDDIEATIRQYLGLDNAKKLRAATTALFQVMGPAQVALAEFKVQIDEDFRKDVPRRTEILKTLGFTDYLKASQQQDQEATISLLYRFSANMDVALQAEIINKGTDAALINTITGYAVALRNANIRQEGAKGDRPQDTEAAINAFNAIYEKVIGIANIAKVFFRGNKTAADRYSYSKVLKSLNTYSNGDTPPLTP